MNLRRIPQPLTAMGSVNVDDETSTWVAPALAPVTAEPEALAARIRHTVSRGAVVFAGDLIALTVPAVLIAPNFLRWWVPTFVAAVLLLSALKGSYRARITMSVAGMSVPSSPAWPFLSSSSASLSISTVRNATSWRLADRKSVV